MNSLSFITVVVVVMVVIGVILATVLAVRNRSKKLKNQFGTEYDHTVETLGGENNARTELEARQKHVKTLDIRPLTVAERERYLSDWTSVRSKFVDEPGLAVSAADHLIMEVMQLRNYPLSDFEQRAADISVVYPELVTNYRAARAIALKNEQQQASTEELRQAMNYYKPLFEELLGKESDVV